MPMNNLEQARHLNSSANAPIRKVITPSHVITALFTLVTSPSNIIGLLRRWTMDFASRLLSKLSNPVGFSVAQNSSARASSFSTTAANFVQGGAKRSALRLRGTLRTLEYRITPPLRQRIAFLRKLTVNNNLACELGDRN